MRVIQIKIPKSYLNTDVIMLYTKHIFHTASCGLWQYAVSLINTDISLIIVN
jgi:hypothetical protein